MKNKELEFRETLKKILEEMIFNIRNLNVHQIMKIRKSMEVNEVIKDIKIERGISNFIYNKERFSYKILLSPKAQYVRKYLGLDIFYLLKDMLDGSPDEKDIMSYVFNELFNIINYGKTTTNILSGGSYYTLIGIYRPMVESYQQTFRCTKEKEFNAKNLDYSVVSKDIIMDGEYRVLFVVPNKTYTNTDINNLTVKTFALPIIMDNNGLPINKALWNVCYNINAKYGTSLAVRCLVPTTTRVDGCKILNGKILEDEIYKYYKTNISKIPRELHYQKLSILILSTVDTIINKEYTI